MMFASSHRWKPFDAPNPERGSIGQFRAEPFNAHRLRIEGIVTYVDPDNLLYSRWPT